MYEATLFPKKGILDMGFEGVFLYENTIRNSLHDLLA